MPPPNPLNSSSTAPPSLVAVDSEARTTAPASSREGRWPTESVPLRIQSKAPAPPPLPHPHPTESVAYPGREQSTAQESISLSNPGRNPSLEDEPATPTDGTPALQVIREATAATPPPTTPRFETPDSPTDSSSPTGLIQGSPSPMAAAAAAAPAPTQATVVATSAAASAASATDDLVTMQPGEEFVDRRVELNEELHRYLDRFTLSGDISWDFEGTVEGFVGILRFTFQDKPTGPGWRGLPARSKPKARESVSYMAYNWLVAQREGQHRSRAENERPPAMQGVPSAAVVDGQGEDPRPMSSGAGSTTTTTTTLMDTANWRNILQEFVQQTMRRALEDVLRVQTSSDAMRPGYKTSVVRLLHYPGPGEEISRTASVPGKKQDAEREACRLVCLRLQEMGVRL